MKTSTFVVISFLGLIFLAASLIWMPLPVNPQPQDPGLPTAAKLNPPTDLPTADSERQLQFVGSPVIAEQAAEQPAEQPAPQPAEQPTSASQPPAASDEPPVSPLLFPTWPKPAIALIATGEQHGYFEPCGCTANQLGGMSRRAGLFAKLQSLGWTIRGMDVGGLSRRTGPQAQMKFETTLQALRKLQYVALALGPEELRLDPGFLLSQVKPDDEIPLTLLGANLTFYGTKDVGAPMNSTIVEHGGIKIGITSVMSDTIRREVIPDQTDEQDANADVTWSDPADALKDALSEFDAKGVRFRILLSQSTVEESRRLAADFPAFDIIVTANGFGDGEQKPELIGNVRLLQVGEKGKMAGVIGLYPDDPTDPIRFELITLSGGRFEDAPAITTLMHDYQERLKDQSIVTAEEPISHPSGASFVGASKCGECHTTAFDIWKNTAHSHGFESLDPIHRRTGFERLQGVKRSFDPECLSCHVTGWDPTEYVRYQGGFLNEEFATDETEKALQGLFSGNQCENCHGPGSQHIELIEAGNDEAAAKLMRVSLEQADKVTCRKCHDADNSPEFKFEDYWEQVKHYGKD